MRGGYYKIPPIRPELQAAYDEMKATGQFFAFAVCQTWGPKVGKSIPSKATFTVLWVSVLPPKKRRMQQVLHGLKSKKNEWSIVPLGNLWNRFVTAFQPFEQLPQKRPTSPQHGLHALPAV